MNGSVGATTSGAGAKTQREQQVGRSTRSLQADLLALDALWTFFWLIIIFILRQEVLIDFCFHVEKENGKRHISVCKSRCCVCCDCCCCCSDVSHSHQCLLPLHQAAVWALPVQRGRHLPRPVLRPGLRPLVPLQVRRTNNQHDMKEEAGGEYFAVQSCEI